MKKNLLAIATLILVMSHFFPFASYGQTPARPYNENQDLRADLKKAIGLAKNQQKHVLVQMGGNWCPWCLRFHKMALETPAIDSVLKSAYIYMLATVPQDKKKRDYELFREYGYPNRFGYPVFLILDGDGKLLHIQDSGILEHCTEKGYDTTKVVRFLKLWTACAMESPVR